MLTDQEQIDALGVLAKMPEAKMEAGRFVQVLPSSPDGVHIVRRDEYAGPEGEGYVDTVTREKDRAIWMLQEHHGPEKYRDGNNGKWIEMTLR